MLSNYLYVKYSFKIPINNILFYMKNKADSQ